MLSDKAFKEAIFVVVLSFCLQL